jgi:hypothetical protein
MTLKSFMDFMTDAMHQWSFVKDMAVDSEAEVPFQTGSALVRLVGYTNTAGAKSLMGWVAFIREPKDGKGARTAYILGAAVAEKQRAKLLPAMAAICKSIELTPPASPAADAINTQGAVYDDPQLLYAVSLPWGWAGKETDKGYEMGQIDFARGNVVSPKVEVIAISVPAATAAKAFGEEAIQKKTPKGTTAQILSQGPAKLSGQDAQQFVVKQTPGPGAEGAPLLFAARLTCVDQKGSGRMLYAVVLRTYDDDAKKAEAILDKVAGTFKVLGAPEAAGK